MEREGRVSGRERQRERERGRGRERECGGGTDPDFSPFYINRK